MTYPEAIAFLYEQLPMFHRVGKAAYKANLDTTLALCNCIQNPEKKFPSVHIAGTNGKGSVSSMLASVLQEAGYKTALFTSPHLIDFRERIRVNGKMIPEKEVIRFITDHISVFNDLKPSFFEWTFALAMDYFHSETVDIAIIETGMGGRLDSTNVVRSILSIITNISDDHKDYLGDTLEKIAVEKAGIIKPGVPVLIGETQKGLSSVFKEIAHSQNSNIQFADRRFQIETISSFSDNPELLHLTVNHRNQSPGLHLKSPLSGKYQLKNIRTVYAATDILRNHGYLVSDNHFANGILHVKTTTGFRGRWEIISERPLTIADTAHNTSGLKHVIQQLKQQACINFHVVLGMVNDKDFQKILRLFPTHWIYYFCKPSIPRGLDVKILAKEGREAGLTGKEYSSVSEAFHAARKAARTDDLIYIGGSTFVVADFLSEVS